MQTQQKKHVLFAGRYETVCAQTIKKWEEFAGKYNAHVHFIFQTEKDGFPEPLEATYQKFFDNGTPDFSFEMTFFSKTNIISRISKYVQERKIALIVIEDLCEQPLAPSIFESTDFNIYSRNAEVPVISLPSVQKQQFAESACN